MNLIRCLLCGKVYVEHHRELCLECRESVEENKQKMKEVVSKHPHFGVKRKKATRNVKRR